MIMHIEFRGEADVAIEYEDHGYEPDTNCHSIEWAFVDDRKVEPTPAEDDAICNRIAERTYEDHFND